MNESLVPNARPYAARYQLEFAETLGSGKDGIVLVARYRAKPSDVAIKIFRFDEAYDREKQTYQRLEYLGVSRVLGFNVPQLLRFDDELRVLEMTIVKRPFILDFAGAYLDRRPEFSPEVWGQWEDEKKEQFQEHWPMVERILSEFEGMRIYLLDVSPANISFLG
jgi:hypothetical protein